MAARSRIPTRLPTRFKHWPWPGGWRACTQTERIDSASNLGQFPRRPTGCLVDPGGHELETDQEAVVQALKDGIRLADRKAAAQAAIRYVQLVYGSQLQQPDDEKPADDPLDVASMSRAERDALKRKLLADNPGLAERLRLVP